MSITLVLVIVADISNSFERVFPFLIAFIVAYASSLTLTVYVTSFLLELLVVEALDEFACARVYALTVSDTLFIFSFSLVFYTQIMYRK